MEKILLDELSNIISAYKEGKDLQFYTSYGEFKDVSEEEFNIEKWYKKPKKFRIKPEQKYRPFVNAEECWNEMQKHKPFGWVKSTLFKDLALVKRVTTLYVEINRDIIDYKDALEKFTFADDNNFGVKVEE